jgi:hypothetical protein
VACAGAGVQRGADRQGRRSSLMHARLPFSQSPRVVASRLYFSFSLCFSGASHDSYLISRVCDDRRKWSRRGRRFSRFRSRWSRTQSASTRVRGAAIAARCVTARRGSHRGGCSLRVTEATAASMDVLPPNVQLRVTPIDLAVVEPTDTDQAITCWSYRDVLSWSCPVPKELHLTVVRVAAPTLCRRRSRRGVMFRLTLNPLRGVLVCVCVCVCSCACTDASAHIELNVPLCVQVRPSPGHEEPHRVPCE